MRDPLCYQYKVRPTKANELNDSLAGAIATVIVFADSDCIGRCRSGRFLARNHWQVEELMRVMAVGQPQLDRFDSAFKKVYRQAELFGIAACYDGWKRHPHRL